MQPRLFANKDGKNRKNHSISAFYGANLAYTCTFESA